MNMRLPRLLTENRFFRSVVRHGYPDSERNKSLTVFSNFFLHIRPVHLRAGGEKFSYTFGLGGISFLLFLILTVTGVMLMFYYVPDVNRAYRDMKDLQFAVPLGVLLRNMHRWGAHAMVAIVVLHMTRVFLTAAYKSPREFNWVVGVGLLVLTLMLSFTGYLLPWDQLAFWAITVGTNMAKSVPILGDHIRYALIGGNLVEQGALIRFYVLHCVVLPLAAAVLIGIHFWRLRKDGGISGPALVDEIAPAPALAPVTAPAPTEETKPLKTYGLMALIRGVAPAEPKDPEKTVSVWPHLFMRELAATLIVVSLLLAVSYFFNAPLEELANASVTPNPAKAPWYFLGLQELVADTTVTLFGFTINGALIGGVLIPGLIVMGLALVPYIDRKVVGVGVYFHRERKRALVLYSVFLITMLVLIIIGTCFRGPGWGFYMPWNMPHSGGH